MSTETASLTYSNLSPETVLNAIDSMGWRCDGRLQALNSFENRVYLVGMEDGPELVAKFYRPNRWTDDAIIEEHHFSQQLAEAEIPVVAPIVVDEQTLFEYDSYRFSLFTKRGGRAPDLENFDTLEQLGRFIGRIHQVGRSSPFDNRPELNPISYGHESRDYLLNSKLLPSDLIPAYESLTAELLTAIDHAYERCGDITLIRTHSDCHPGNILWTDEGPHIVDFDDARMTPAAQDLWMFLSGDRANMTQGLDALLEGYCQFSEFNARELHLVEALRTLRLMHYYAWLGRRWEDPAFKIAFPWFNSQQCWEQHILSLREQAAALYEEPLAWYG